MSDLNYVLNRIEHGARVKLALDYFGQPMGIVPRRWLPGTRKIRLGSQDLSHVQHALRSRHGARSLPEVATTARS